MCRVAIWELDLATYLMQTYTVYSVEKMIAYQGLALQNFLNNTIA